MKRTHDADDIVDQIVRDSLLCQVVLEALRPELVVVDSQTQRDVAESAVEGEEEGGHVQNILGGVGGVAVEVRFEAAKDAVDHVAVTSKDL